MNRFEFMQRLEQLLTEISPEEREEALQYYNDYLNDAGVENEQDALESLGSPEKVARTIREGLGDGGLGGEFTENGFKDSVSAEEKKNEVGAARATKDFGENADVYSDKGYGANADAYRDKGYGANADAYRDKGYGADAHGYRTNDYGSGYQGNPWRKAGQEGPSFQEAEPGKKENKKLSGGMLALIVLGCVLASPVLLFLGIGGLGAAIGIVGGILGGVIGVIATALGLSLAAVVLIVMGIGMLFNSPVIGACLLGTGLLLGGFAVLFIWLTVWLCGVGAPWVIRKLTDLCSRWFHKKKEGEERI